jgi:hypothetical protein
MANQETLNGLANETKGTLASAAKTIRALIIQRNDALAAAKPEDVAAAKAERLTVVEAADVQAGLEQARLDTEAAIIEANAPAVPTPKSAPPAPNPVV